MTADGDMHAGQRGCARYRAHVLLLQLQVLAYVLLVSAPLCAMAQAMAAGTVDIAAVVGFSNTFQPGRWTPLHVTVTNHGGDLRGELEVQVTGGNALRGQRFVTLHRRALDLHRNARKTLHFTVFPQGLSHPLVIRVHSAGRELARAEVDLRTRFADQRLLLVLSRDAHLDYLNDDAANGQRVLYPHPDLLPVHWRGYDAVAAIVVHGVSLERLSASQFEALRKWIAQGGILAVSGGPDYALLRSPRLAVLLPGQPVGITRVDADALQRAFSSALDVSRPVHINRLDGFNGRALLRAGAVPIIVERTLGLGRVIYLTFDVASYPFDRWAGMRELWLDSLRLPPPTKTSRTLAEPVLESPLLPLIRAESANFPSPLSVLCFLVFYLGMLMAGYRFSVRGPRGRKVVALWTWTAPVLFAPAAWLLFGPPVFPRGATSVAVAVIEPLPRSNYARLRLDLGVYANRSGSLRLDYRGAEPVLYPTRQAQREGNAEDWVFGEGTLRFVEPLNQRRYVLHALEGEDVIAFRLEASVHDDALGPRLVLDNASGWPLENLWLVFDGYAYELGSIAAGARVERRLTRRLQGVKVGEVPWWNLLRPPSTIPLGTFAPTRIVLERRLQAAGALGYPSPGNALLIGYTASPLKPARASVRWPSAERALVVYQIAAVPPKLAVGKTGSGSLEPGNGDHGRSTSHRGLDAAAGADVVR